MSILTYFLSLVHWALIHPDKNHSNIKLDIGLALHDNNSHTLPEVIIHIDRAGTDNERYTEYIGFQYEVPGIPRLLIPISKE